MQEKSCSRAVGKVVHSGSRENVMKSLPAVGRRSRSMTKRMTVDKVMFFYYI